MTQLLSEYENDGINARVLKMHDDTFKVLVFNVSSGKELVKLFGNYTEANRFAETSTLVQLNG
jgi:hypothetical protein